MSLPEPAPNNGVELTASSVRSASGSSSRPAFGCTREGDRLCAYQVHQDAKEGDHHAAPYRRARPDACLRPKHCRGTARRQGAATNASTADRVSQAWR